MGKIFFLSSNLFHEPYPVYPLGMAVVSAALTAKGHDVLQFDHMVERANPERLKKNISEFGPDYICISLRNIDNVDSLTPESAWALAGDKSVIDQIREISSAPIIVGGSAFSALPEDILDYLKADYGVVGEGEQVICDLIDALNNGRPVSRIIDGHRAPLIGEAMCSPLWNKRLMDFYVEKSGMINLQTKRGCPHNCLYCVYPALEGKRFRPRDPKAVVNDIKELQLTYHIDTLFITDSIFNDPAGHYMSVAEEILSAGVHIRWAGYFRPKGLALKEMKLLKRAGLYAMEVGTDGGCNKILDTLKKGFHFEEVLAFNADCIKAEIPSAHFFMFGGPGETEDTIKESLANIQKLEKCVIMGYSGIRILPGADLYARAIQDGLLKANTPLLKPIYYFSPHVDIPAMNQTLEAAFECRRECIFPPAKGERLISAMNFLGYKGLLWDRLISFQDDLKRRRKKRFGS